MSDRYFLESPPTGDRATLSGAEAHHLVHVMRAKPGTEVVLFDGSGVEFTVRVERVGRSEVELAVLSCAGVDRELGLRLVLGVALPKGDRQRWLIEKATELGVARLVPLITARGVAQPVESALARLRRAVIEASKQCGRNRLMEIAEPQTLEAYLAECPAAALRLLAHPGGQPLNSVCAQHEHPIAEIHLAVGPEGGFTEDEVSIVQRNGWQLVGLGRRILRVETAALLLAGLIANWTGKEGG